MPQKYIASKKARTFLSLVNSSDGDVNTFSTYNDPLYYEFNPIFHFTATSGLLAAETNRNSALAYLNRIGETVRYEKLQFFISLLKRLCDEAPWVFKSITGLDEIQRRISEPLLNDRKLNFEMYEAIDFRINALIELYQDIVFDYTRGVEVLPRNLMYFSMSVIVTDARVLQADPNGNNFRLFGRDINHLDVDLENVSHKLFHFGKCRFLENSGEMSYADITDAEYTDAVVNLEIGYRTFAKSSKFTAITGNVTLSPTTTNPPRSKTYENVAPNTESLAGTIGVIKETVAEMVDFDQIVENLQSVVRDSIADGVAYVGNTLESRINTTTLGNVYQQDIATFLQLVDATSFEQVRNVFDF